MIPFDLHHLWPAAIYLAPLALLFLGLYWRLATYRQKKIAQSDLATLRRSSSGIFWTKTALFCIAWLLGVAALMQPVGNGHYPEGAMPPIPQTFSQPQLRRKAHDVILLIDASASMQIKDARQGKSRLDFAKDIANEFVANLTGENAALYAFTSLPTELSPLTMDYLFVRFMLTELQVNEGGIAGTNITEALTSMRKKFFAQPTKRLKTLILLTDGGDTTIESLSGVPQQQGIDKLMGIIADAKENNLRVYTIGMGSLEGGTVPGVTDAGRAVKSQLEEGLLKQLAEKGRGKYYPANAYTPMRLVEDLMKHVNQDPQYNDERQELGEGSLLQSLLDDSGLIYNHYYQIPLGLALLLLSLIIFWPDTRHRIDAV